MADINWPIATSVGQLYVSDNGNVWKWTGTYWEAIGTGNSLLAGVGSNSQVAIWANATTVIGSPRITYTDIAGTNVRVEINDSGIGSFLGRGFLGASANNSAANLFLSSGSSTSINSPLIQLTRFKNTIDIPQPVTTGDYLGQIQFRGSKNNAGILDIGSSIIVEATETWSELSNLKGSKFTIKTVPNGGSLIEKFSIGGDGLIKFYETYTFPFSNGNNGQVLTTNGTGTLSWTTISGTVGGTGTENYVSKWTTGGTTLTDSQIQDNGSSVGIGSIDSVTKLSVETNSLDNAFRATASKTSGTGTVAGTFQSIGNGSGPNKGLFVTAANNTNYNVGIHVQASTTSPYALWLQDGSQGSGKFLKSVTSDGKSNWSNIMASDVSGAVGGTGVDGRLAIWNGTSTVTSDPFYKYSTQFGDGTIEIGGAGNTVKLGSFSSGIRSTTYAQFLLESFNNSNQYPWVGMSYQRGTTASGTPPTNGDVLGELRFLGFNLGAKIRAVASQNHVAGASAGTDLTLFTAPNTSLTPVERLRIKNDGAIRFNQSYSFPVSAGTVGQTFRVDGSGDLYWAPMLSGSGTTNYLPKWSNSSGDLTNSQIVDNGTNIGVSTTPSALSKLTVLGSSTNTTAISGISGSNGGYGIKGESKVNGTQNNIGIYANSTNTLGDSTGIGIGASASTGSTAVGLDVLASGTGYKYSLHLQDGTEANGKFLKSVSDTGHANWANITAADVSGIITGAGSTNKMAFWSSGTNLTYNNDISRYSFTNPYRIVTENGVSVANSYSKTSIQGSSISILPLVGSTQENGDQFTFTLGSTGTTSPYFIFESSEKLRVEDSTVGGILWNMKNSSNGINQELASIKIKTSNDWNGSFTGDKGSSFVISTAAKGQYISEKFEIDEGLPPIPGTAPFYTSSVKIKNDSNLIIGVGTEASSKIQANLTYGYHRYGLEIYNKGLFVSTYQGQLNSSSFDIYGARILANSIPGSGFENTGLSTVVTVANQALNIGIKSEISLSGIGSTSVAGWFISPGSNTNSYALRIEDGNQAAGKFLKSINSQGYAEWSSITASDIQGFSGGIGGSGTTYRLPVWSGSSGATGQTSLINSRFYDDGVVAGFNIGNPSSYSGAGPIFVMESTDPETFIPYNFIRTVGATGTSMQVTNADFLSDITGTAPADSVSSGIRSIASGAKKYNVGLVGSAITSSEYPLPSNVPSNSNIAIFATIQSSSSTQTNPNYYGVVSEVYFANTTNSVIGILSAVTNTAVGGTKYAIQLKDGTQGTGKFLKSVTSDGKANWAALSVSDTGLTLTTTGTSGAATLVGNTLNIPQYSGGGGVSGAGTPNYIAKFYNSGTVADSQIQDNGSTISINTPLDLSTKFIVVTTTTNDGIKSLNSTIGTGTKYGMSGQSYGSGGINVGGFFYADSGTTNYAIMLQDGTEETGKFLKSVTSDGKANWSTISFSDISGAQATLVSGTNIKSINSQTLLGSGNITVQPTLVSGTNIKSINSQTLLGSGDITVQPTLVSGTNIKTVNGQSLLGSGNIAISGGTGTVGSSGAVQNAMPFWIDASNQILGPTPMVYSGGTFGIFGNAAPNAAISIKGASAAYSWTVFVDMTETGVGIHSQVTGTGAWPNIGFNGYASGSSLLNLGVRGYAESTTGATSVGGHFWTPNGATAYAVQIQDASSTTPGKFLKNMTSEGHARWQSITVSDVSGAQASLVSGTNIKTVNGQSLLGSGNITTSSGASGTFTSADGKTITVVNGLITSIV